MICPRDTKFHDTTPFSTQAYILRASIAKVPCSISHLVTRVSFFRPIREYLVRLTLLTSHVFLFDYFLVTIVQLEGLHRAVM